MIRYKKVGKFTFVVITHSAHGTFTASVQQYEVIDNGKTIVINEESYDDERPAIAIWDEWTRMKAVRLV